MACKRSGVRIPVAPLLVPRAVTLPPPRGSGAPIFCPNASFGGSSSPLPQAPLASTHAPQMSGTSRRRQDAGGRNETHGRARLCSQGRQSTLTLGRFDSAQTSGPAQCRTVVSFSFAETSDWPTMQGWPGHAESRTKLLRPSFSIPGSATPTTTPSSASTRLRS